MSRVTPAERCALEAWKNGHGSVRGAANLLGKSPRTVEHQILNARARLGVDSTMEAVRVVIFNERSEPV
jgi:DNA-binding CsgD family transcriptional regulator